MANIPSRNFAESEQVMLEPENPTAEWLQTKFNKITICSEHFGTDCGPRSMECTSAAKFSQKEHPRSTRLTSECDDNSVEADDSEESIEIVEPTCIDIAHLHEWSQTEKDVMEHSSYSTTRTNNSDIFVLKAHEQYYGDELEVDNCFQRRDSSYMFLMSAPKHHRTGCTCNESNVLLIDCDVCIDDCNHQHYYSGTDSDVEVLMTEEINDSVWSIGVSAATMPILEDKKCSDGPTVKNVDQEAKAMHTVATDPTSPSVSMRKQESTDQDVSVEELSCSSLSSHEQLSRTQLLNVISDQAARIRQLEATLQCYRNAQLTLIQHVDAMRTELCLTCESDLQKSQETIN